MSGKTAIEWATDVWNPVTGCDRVSPGCANCYAAKMAARLKAMGDPRYQKDGARASGPGFGVTLHPDLLDLPLRWKKPRMVFVNSMSDLFHEDVPDWYIDRVFMVMARAPQHTFQVLTKRPMRARQWAKEAQEALPLGNVWLGVSVENQRWANERIPLLLGTPAAVRFVSCEPLLGPLDLRWSRALHWVIVGGESGAIHTRDGPERALVEQRRHNWGEDGYCTDCSVPLEPAGNSVLDDPRVRLPRSSCKPLWRPKPQALQWLRDIRDQCIATGTPFFFKAWPMPPHKPGGPALLDGREWREMPHSGYPD